MSVGVRVCMLTTHLILNLKGQGLELLSFPAFPGFHGHACGHQCSGEMPRHPGPYVICEAWPRNLWAFLVWLRKPHYSFSK